MKKSSYRINPLEGSLFKSTILFAIPLILSGLLQLFFNAADIIVVGNFAGSHEMAAVGSTASTTSLLISLCIGLSVGANVVVANRIGARDKNGVSRSVHAAMCLSVVSGLLMGAVGFLLSETLLHLLDTPSDIIDSATTYLQIYCLGLPFNIICNFGNAILRANGDTRRPLIFLSIAGVVNVLLNLIFVLVFHMGASGVALATSISQFVAAWLVVLCLMHEESDIRLSLKSLRFHKEECLRIIAVGLPAGFQSSLFSISNMLIQSSINSFGADAVAGNSAAVSLEGFTYISMNAMYQTTLTFIAQNRGAGNYDRINKSLLVSLGYVTVIGLLMGAIMQFFGKELLHLYTKDPAAIRYGLIRLPFFAFPYVLCGYMEVVAGAVRGLGYSIMPLITSLFGSCFLRIVWVYTIFAQFRTLESLYLSYMASWIITIILHTICFFFARKKCIKEGETKPKMSV